MWAIEHAFQVALRKESVDRNKQLIDERYKFGRVALRKESVDRNGKSKKSKTKKQVALRKESVDRNLQKLAEAIKPS